MAIRIRGRGKPGGESEASVQRLILDYLEHKGVFHWRANSGMAWVKKGGGGMRPIKLNPEGTPDILLVAKGGRLVGVEVKKPGGRLGDAQKAWMERAGSLGVLCLVVTSLDALIDALEAEGVQL